MWGNGLRPDVWLPFRERFGIPEVAEFFNSSEGMLSLFIWNRGEYSINCVGHHGALLRFATTNTYVPVAINYETNEIVRDPKTGFAKRNSHNEGGEILVKILSEADFPGYFHNPEATSKKFERDVFRKGDLFYRTGDALRRTDDGRWFFMDRLGVSLLRFLSSAMTTVILMIDTCRIHIDGKPKMSALQRLPRRLADIPASWRPTYMESRYLGMKVGQGVQLSP